MRGSGTLEFAVTSATPSSTSVITTTTEAFNDDNWHHLVGIYKGGSTAADAELYVDGELIDIDNAFLNPFTGQEIASYKIGRAGHVMDNFYNGLIDEVRIYDRALSAFDIQQLFNSVTPTPTPKSTPMPTPTPEPTTDGTILFSEDFEAYFPGSNLAGQGGWTGDEIRIGNGAFLDTQVLNGRDDIGINIQSTVNHTLGRSLNNTEITKVAFDAWATSNFPLTHNMALGLTTSLDSSFPEVFWDPAESSSLMPRIWSFDARSLTGNSNHRVDISGGYDQAVTMTIVVDGVANEIFGIYDFGDGPKETTHFSVTPEQIGSLNTVAISVDFRSPTTSTPLGSQYIGGEFDNILVTTSGEITTSTPIATATPNPTPEATPTPDIVVEGITVITDIEVGSSPVGIDVNSINNRIYVTNFNDKTVSVINGLSNQVIDTITVGNTPSTVGVNSLTNRIYVGNQSDFAISVIDGTTNEVINNIRAGNFPSGFGINANTNRIYVANINDGTVSVIDGSLNQVIDTITVERNPANIVVNTGTNFIYVANTISDNISVIDGSSNQITDTITVGDFPNGIGINNITNRIYVANGNENTVSVIDSLTNQVIDTINLGEEINTQLNEVGVNQTTNHIFITDSNNNDIIVIDGSTNQVIDSISAGDTPTGVAVNPITNRIYITNLTSNNVTVIQDGIVEIPKSTPTPVVTPTPTPVATPTPIPGKSFTFKCRTKSLINARAGLEKLIMELGQNEDCTVTLTQLEPGVFVEVATYLRTGPNLSIKVSPENGMTDSNGELEFTISAINEGVDWIAWAVRNDKGEFEFSRSAYNDGTAWGMFVEVK